MAINSNMYPSIALALAVSALFAFPSEAGAVLHEGRFTLVLGPGSLPVSTPFVGTITFDDSTVDPEHPHFVQPGAWIYNVQLESATLTGGDSSQGGSYVIDESQGRDIHYSGDGRPIGLSLTFRNATLKTAVNFSNNFSNPLCLSEGIGCILSWTESKALPPDLTIWVRGGNVTLEAPLLAPLPPVPEPVTWKFVAVGALLLGTALGARRRRVATLPAD
jgi:hypothetical protein